MPGYLLEAVACEDIIQYESSNGTEFLMPFRVVSGKFGERRTRTLPYME